MKSFAISQLEDYKKALKILYSIPFIQIENNTINANGLYNFLNEAKNSILKEYDEQNSPFTV